MRTKLMGFTKVTKLMDFTKTFKAMGISFHLASNYKNTTLNYFKKASISAYQPNFPVSPLQIAH